jgi:hypothetical protein
LGPFWFRDRSASKSYAIDVSIISRAWWEYSDPARRVPDRGGVQIVNWNQYLSILFDISSNFHVLLDVDNCAEKRRVQ